ncbi:MAG: siderophore-interacting protein [Acidobacteria bacterium]|nr:siderophore-interacting protein [Acidobacteriota bacterium]
MGAGSRCRQPRALSGPGRGYAIDRSARAFLLGGDETAIPAISELLEALPTETPVRVCIEVTHPEARLVLPDHPQSTVEWCDLPSDGSPGDALIHRIKDADLDPGIRVWMAGEAGAMHRIRRLYFQDRGLARADAVIRGYWKRPRP